MIGHLYHWSPRERCQAIKTEGLKSRQPSVRGHAKQGSISFSLDPATAWEYSHGAWQSHGVFDLWMVRLEKSDDVRILPMWGAEIIEIRVHNNIAATRLNWVGERTA